MGIGKSKKNWIDFESERDRESIVMMTFTKGKS